MMLLYHLMKKEFQVLKDETIKQMMEVNWVGECEEYKKKALHQFKSNAYNLILNKNSYF